EKATELGVAHVILCEMSRSISKFKGDGDLKSKTEKYSQVAEAAAKQSKRLDVPRITVCQKIEQAIELLNFESGQRFCCSLSSSAIPIQEISLQKRGQVLAVGPEGDFSPEEEQKLCESQFELVSLGTNVLRSETAAIAAIAMTQARYSED
ncbi:MAG: RNA methyltransferase, partial [Bdellovibrionales bacterium]|nr:RNA methyltransferase [Bdellovibrionales bacterium]